MSNKFISGSKSIFNGNSNDNVLKSNFFTGVVLTNTDKSDAGRVKVRILGLDEGISDSDLPFCFPMLQKFFHITPKVGEVVFVLVPSSKNPYSDRVFFGPVISQPQMLAGDTYINGATSMLNSGFHKEKQSPSTVPSNKGVSPNKEDVAILGRNNSDLTFKHTEVVIRAGVFELNTLKGSIPNFNMVNQSFIQIKHNLRLDGDTIKTGVINLVSDKINLLTHKEGSPRFILNDQDDLITKDELNKIIREAHPLVFGDTLVTYLKFLRNAFLNHVHAYNGLKPEDLAGSNSISECLKFDLDSMLSKNIRIN